MNKFLLALALCLFSIALAKAQNLEEEVEFNYIKAKYLLDTERYEDAIKEFTKIIQGDSKYKDAILLRAKAKYAMAAYQGTKKDVLLYAVSKGMSEMALTLLGKADYKLGNNDAALSSLSIAAAVNNEDAQIAEFLGNIYEEKDQLLKACEFWRKSAKMGSSKSRIKSNKVCGEMEPEEEKVDRPKRKSKVDNAKFPNDGKKVERKGDESSDEVTDETTSNDDPEDDILGDPSDGSVLQPNDDESGEESQTTDEDPDTESTDDEVVVVEEVDKMPEEDNTPNEIVIDEDLTLVIKGQGLGNRRILDQPNILILSDIDGTVAVDICVNKRGKVETAEFNSKLSTIAKKSLVSLAIRKSKDFWFEKNDFKEQCGVIMFKITGS